METIDETLIRNDHAEVNGVPAPDGTPAHGNVVRHIAPLTVEVPTLAMYALDQRRASGPRQPRDPGARRLAAAP
jgi:hypothetical protein